MNTDTIYIYIAHHSIGTALVVLRTVTSLIGTLVSRLLQKPLFRAMCTASDCYVDTEPRPQPCCSLMIALLILLWFLIEINMIDGGTQMLSGAVHTDIQLVIIGSQMLVLINKHSLDYRTTTP